MRIPPGQMNTAHPCALNLSLESCRVPLVLVYNLAGAGGPVWAGCCCPLRGTWSHSPSHQQCQRCSLQPLSLTHEFCSQPRFPHQSQPNSTRPGRPVLVHVELPTLQKAQTQIPAEQGSSSSWLRTFPWEAEPGAWWRWPFQLSQAPRTSRGLLSSLLPSSPLPLPAPSAAGELGCCASSCPQRPHNSCGLNYQNNILIVS